VSVCSAGELDAANSSQRELQEAEDLELARKLQADESAAAGPSTAAAKGTTTKAAANKPSAKSMTPEEIRKELLGSGFYREADLAYVSDSELVRCLGRHRNRMAYMQGQLDEQYAGQDICAAARSGLARVLREKASILKVTQVVDNPHSMPGKPLYERFYQAWAQHGDALIKLVFHGTAAENVDAICLNGLDPKRRSGQAYGPGEYFGKNATISLGYSKGGNKMIIFAVLVPKKKPAAGQRVEWAPNARGYQYPQGHKPVQPQHGEGITHEDASMVVVNKIEQQLPIATVVFDPGRVNHAAAQGAAGLMQPPPGMAAMMANMTGGGVGQTLGGGPPAGFLAQMAAAVPPAVAAQLERYRNAYRGGT